jgi:hypothetical protein
VETSGEANVDTTLDFVFTGVGTATVTIELQRVVLFGLLPEASIREQLEWLTQIYAHDDGTEQRESIRVYPRQFFEWTVIAEDGVERSYAENILFEWQSRIFGVPVWHELTRLTTAASVSDTTITVGSTANRDFREGGLVVIYSDQFTFDVGTIITGGIGATTITVESGLLNAYPVGARVAPLRTGAVVGNVQGRRYPSGAQELQLRFQVDDNIVDLADDSTWTKFNSKVVLDDKNLINGTLEESFTQDIIVIDNLSGKVTRVPKVDRNRRQHGKGFLCQGLAELWRVRQLLHSLRGRQVSCYISTFAKDLVPIDDLTNASTDLVVSNVGYTQFVRLRQNRNAIVVYFKDGSTPLYRTITDSNLDSATQETLTVDAVWPDTFTPEEVDRISFVQEVRQNSDSVTIDHDLNGRTHRVLTNLIGVYE